MPSNILSTGEPPVFTSLVGREVYFRMSPRSMGFNLVMGFTPDKLYTILENHTQGWHYILNDDGRRCLIAQSPNGCAHLNRVKGWSLKKLPVQPRDEVQSNGDS